MGNAVYDIIKERVTAMLVEGKVPWQCPYKLDERRYDDDIYSPWNCAFSAKSKKPYSFLNHIMLGFRGGNYWTFKQAIEAGYKIKKGAHANQIFFWKILDNKDSNDVRKQIPFLRYYTVYHEDDVEGLVKLPASQPRKTFKPSADANPYQECEQAEDIITDYFLKYEGLKLKFNNRRVPCFIPSKDQISMPSPSHFNCIEEYYSAFFHEMAHSTGHESRLNRIGKNFITQHAYSKEELVAEIASAALLFHCGMDAPVIENNAAYVAGWLESLNNDITQLTWACSRAEKAVAMILGQAVEKDI